MSQELFVGLMSGTSLDGVDAVLADLSTTRPRLLADAYRPFGESLRAELLALNTAGADELARAALAGNALAAVYAEATRDVLASAKADAAQVRAVGCHGQTVRHRPERGYTIQLGNAALLAELAGIAVVSDFRSRDVAAGGQGAPLVPAFHAAVFADPGEARAALNLGGIANLTILPRSGAVRGFDCGPGNCLLDLWARRHLGAPYDDAGQWGATGAVMPDLLARMLAEPYFAAPPPKSTGRDLFHAGWLEAMLHGGEEPRDVQATLLELTAHSASQALLSVAPESRRVIVCGGGAHNLALMRRLESLLAPRPVQPSTPYGLAPGQVEAAAFAWMAKQALDGLASSLASVTGARGNRRLGAIYPR
ncbi:MAG TPA: anhydro-N-acetylmuramic acid kinase [Burkholderiales bacterium]|nr:anhydro-N-acetylmuramic acid kinase [Burkholderiales bacterium]